MTINNNAYIGFWQSLEEADCCVCEITGFRVDNRSYTNHYTLNRSLPRSNYALTYVQEGSYLYTPDTGESFVCQSGDMSFLPKGAIYTHVNTRPSRMLVIYFSLKTPDGGSFKPELTSICRISCRDSSNFERMFAQVTDRYFSLLSSRSEVKSALYKLFGALSREEKSMSLNEYELARIAPAIERLSSDDFSLCPTVSLLARTCCMSEYSFRELFKKYSGISPKSYIDELRVKKVEELLANPEMTVTDAARACGFEEPSYFFKLYKRLRGHSPKSGQ